MTQISILKNFILSFLFFAFTSNAFAQDLSYYLPKGVSYNPAIPKPKDVIFHEVGASHVTHDRLVQYMRAIATAAPERVKLETMGFTYEDRPQVLLIITSPKNQQRLEEIRQQHVRLTDPSQSGNMDVSNMPIVVWIGHSIHGNEPSGANAALVGAYHLAAAQGKEIEELLDNTVILYDPAFNPDGLQRFSTWVNQHKSKNLVSDPNSREFNEVWPGGRFNHYWFDLNRDWLPAVHNESKNRLEWFHKWKPNILTDHHEQGSNSTFFFQPGVPSRVNPLTPNTNQELTAKLGKYHAEYLDKIGTLYFTKEAYDDFYYGKGSTYPDVNGAIGILFEQASSRGHLQETDNGLLSFPSTIRNQFTTELSTLEGGRVLRKEFLNWQKEFYQSAIKEAAAAPNKAYVYGSKEDKTTAAIFTEMLLRHQIKVYELDKNINAAGNNFTAGNSFIIPLNQPQERLIKAIFEKTSAYKDSIFYDITAWTMPLAFGLPYATLNANEISGVGFNKMVTAANYPKGNVATKSAYAYALEWSDFNAPKALYALQKAGVIVKLAQTKFTVNTGTQNKSFGYGTILIPVAMQNKNSEELYQILQKVATENQINFESINTGYASAGSDLGSRNFGAIEQPKIAMIVGNGANALDAGEVWFLLDQRFNIPSSHIEQSSFNRIDVSKYNTIIMVGGTYNEINKEKLKSWVQAGGVLILTEEAVKWAAQAGISSVTFKKTGNAMDSAKNASYADLSEITGAQSMSGAIFGADVDLTHPLAYGYNNKLVSLFKANSVFMEKGNNAFAAPFTYGKQPLQSGWISEQNKANIKNTAAVIVNALGSGRVINIADNPNFRAFWLGGSKLFMNAIFFGRNISAASARSEE